MWVNAKRTKLCWKIVPIRSAAKNDLYWINPEPCITCLLFSISKTNIAKWTFLEYKHPWNILTSWRRLSKDLKESFELVKMAYVFILCELNDLRWINKYHHHHHQAWFWIAKWLLFSNYLKCRKLLDVEFDSLTLRLMSIFNNYQFVWFSLISGLTFLTCIQIFN